MWERWNERLAIKYEIAIFNFQLLSCLKYKSNNRMHWLQRWNFHLGSCILKQGIRCVTKETYYKSRTNLKWDRKEKAWKEEERGNLTLFVVLVFEFGASLQKNIIAWSFEKKIQSRILCHVKIIFCSKIEMLNLSIKGCNLVKFYVSKTSKSSSMQERRRRERSTRKRRRKHALCKKNKEWETLHGFHDVKILKHQNLYALCHSSFFFIEMMSYDVINLKLFSK
jgi:hypothetical protein